MQRAEGYTATIVAGQVTYRDGEPTDALPGRLLRGAQAAPRRHGGGIGAAMNDGTPTFKPKVLEEACEWTAKDVADPAQWTEHLSPAEVDELEEAVAARVFVSDDFLRDRQGGSSRCRRWARACKAIERELIDGRGFVLLPRPAARRAGPTTR